MTPRKRRRRIREKKKHCARLEKLEIRMANFIVLHAVAAEFGANTRAHEHTPLKCCANKYYTLIHFNIFILFSFSLIVISLVAMKMNTLFSVNGYWVRVPHQWFHRVGRIKQKDKPPMHRSCQLYLIVNSSI